MFSNFELKLGYHQIWVRSGDIPKTVCMTRYGLYEYSVMHIGLSNTPKVFMEYMNKIYHP